jgi:small subunit ribosomal protein S20
VKKFNAAVVKDSAEAKAVLAEAVPTIAKAASRGIIHKNTAARSISRLTKKLNKAATV